MKRVLLRVALGLMSIGLISGCNVTLGPTVEREATWAKLGTPGRVLAGCKADVLLPGPDGWDEAKRTKADLGGMIVLDEPTYEIYRSAWEEQRRAGASADIEGEAGGD